MGSKLYRRRSEDTVAVQGLRLLRSTAKAIEDARGKLGWSTRAVISSILDSWAAGRRWKPPRTTVALGGVAVVLALVTGWAGSDCASARKPPAQETLRGPTREEAFVAVDELEQGGSPGRRIIPPKPAEWQKGPPCSDEAAETLVNGACYIEVARRKPPCGSVLLEHAGACYRAVAKPEKRPVSVDGQLPQE